jgi:hypothetical protein
MNLYSKIQKNHAKITGIVYGCFLGNNLESVYSRMIAFTEIVQAHELTATIDLAKL